MSKNVIVDYGMGNLFSISRAVEHCGHSAEITSDRKKILQADKVILPGVGAFGDAMKELEVSGLADALKSFIETERPLLGICLGMQILFDFSDEFGRHNGLGCIPGAVKKFNISEEKKSIFKIPQIGWNKIGGHANRECDKELFVGISSDTLFYFVHSYVCVPNNQDHIAAETQYGPVRFCSAIRKNAIWGCQFHPEKSAEAGLRVYSNFLKR